MAADWSRLPNPALALISDRLRSSPEDHFSFRSTCSTWSSAAVPADPYPPFIALHHAGGSHSFARLHDNCLRPLALPPFDLSSVCCGSSHGWLIFVEPSLGIFLFNPVTTSRIDLPPITGNCYYSVTKSGDKYVCKSHSNGKSWRRSFERAREHLAKKIILSSDPAEPGSACIALAILSKMVLFCRPGDAAWTSIETPTGFYGLSMDALYYRGMFHVSDLGVVYNCELEPHPQLVELATVQLYPDDNPHDYAKCYLVDCAGDLLVIGFGFKDFYDAEPEAIEIYPFKLVQEECQARMVNLKLENAFNNQAVFVGLNHAFSIPDPPYHFYGNCIYLADYEDTSRAKIRVIDLEYGHSRYLKNYRVEGRAKRRRVNRVPSWFLPNLRQPSFAGKNQKQASCSESQANVDDRNNLTTRDKSRAGD